MMDLYREELEDNSLATWNNYEELLKEIFRKPAKPIVYKRVSKRGMNRFVCGVCFKGCIGLSWQRYCSRNCKIRTKQYHAKHREYKRKYLEEIKKDPQKYSQFIQRKKEAKARFNQKHDRL